MDALEGTVYKLRNSLYSVKQVALEWNRTTNRVLKAIGFETSAVNPCVYAMTMEAPPVYLCLYVNELLIAAKSSSTITR